MIVTICGSIAYINEMYELKTQLEQFGFEVKVPPNQVKGPDGKIMPAREYYDHKKAAGNDSWVWRDHSALITEHFEKVAAADAVLIANYSKNGIENYIGANTLMEMGLAFYLGKPIFLLHPVPEIAYKEEIIGMRPVVIQGDLQKITELASDQKAEVI